MITIIQSNGTIVKTQPDRVYQGSNKVNQIVLVGAFAQNLIPQISFKLPQSADYTPFDYFTPANIPTDEGISAWTYDIPITVTQEYGNVKFQIKAEDSEGNVVASGQCSFEVERGTPPDISDIPDLEPLETIKQILQDIYAIYENGDLLSKGVFPYDETFNYPEGATVFDRESEQFYMSLVNNNIGNAVSDSAKWRRVASFMLYGGTFDGSGVITASEYVPELDGTNITTIDLDKYISRYFKCAEPFDFSGESYLIDDIALCNGNISPSWTKFNNNGHVISVNRKTGIVVLSASDVGATTVSTIISRNQSLPASEASPDFVQNGSELLYKSAQNNSSGGVSYTYTTTKGDKGDAATIQVGTVTTGEAGTQASVTNIGTANAAVFDFTIPKGDKGDKGEAGETNSLSIGTVTTGEAGTQASATITGTAPNQILNLTIPKGDIGATGEQGPQGPEGLQYLTVSRVFNSRYPVGTVAPYYLNDFNRTPVVNDIFSTLCANQYYTTFKIINAETRQMQSITEVNIQGPQGIEYLTTNRNFTNEYNIGDTTSINNNEFNRTPVLNDIFSTLCANKYYTTFKVLSVSDTSCSCQVIAKVNLQGVSGADGADGVQDNELIFRETLPTASSDSPDFVQTTDGLAYKKLTASDGGLAYSYETLASQTDITDIENQIGDISTILNSIVTVAEV